MSKPSTQAVLWCAINSFLLITCITPLYVITINFIMVPALIMFTRLEAKLFVLTYAISLAVVFAVTGSYGLFLLILSLIFLPPSIVMGRLYKQISSVRAVLVGGTITLLAEFLIALVGFYALGYRPMDTLQELLTASLETMPTFIHNSTNQSQLDLLVHNFLQLTPLMLISGSFYFVLIAHGISRWILRKGGMEVHGLPPMREWRLPKTMVWYFLVVTIADFFISIDSNSMLSMIVWNLLPLLTVAFAVQGIGFFFHLAYIKKKSRFLPVVSIIAALFYFPLIFLYSILGALDVMFSLRNRLKG